MFTGTDKLSLIIPAHNEEGAIKESVLKCLEQLNSLGIVYELIVVNDGSTDRTGEILKTITGIKVISNPYNLGYGASLKRGIKASAGNWLMIIDADGTYPIAKIGELLSFAGEYDMVVGHRQHQSDHFGRRPAKWFLKKLASFLAGKTIPDLNSGMRVFRREIALQFFHLFPSGFSFTSTITLACFANEYTVKYVDIPYYKRVGQSGIRPRHFFDFTSLIIRLFIYFRPIKMLSPVALVFFASGFVKLVRDYAVDGRIGTLASLLIIFSIQLFILALVSETIINRSTD